jgi:hypothetical protein
MRNVKETLRMMVQMLGVFAEFERHIETQSAIDQLRLNWISMRPTPSRGDLGTGRVTACGRTRFVCMWAREC